MSGNSIIATMPLAMATGTVRNPRAGHRSL